MEKLHTYIWIILSDMTIFPVISLALGKVSTIVFKRKHLACIVVNVILMLLMAGVLLLHIRGVFGEIPDLWNFILAIVVCIAHGVVAVGRILEIRKTR